MHSQQPPGVVQIWSTLQCSMQNNEQCGYDHAPVTRGRMRAQFPLPHGPQPTLPEPPPPPPQAPPERRLSFLSEGSGNAGTQDRVDNDRASSPCTMVQTSHRFQAQQCMSEICVLTQSLHHTSCVLSQRAAARKGELQASERRVLSRTGTQALCRLEGHSRRREHISSGMAHTHTTSQPQRRSSLSKNASVSKCKH